jgi:multisubunit Na+/H+ antiporter MnhG subunit
VSDRNTAPSPEARRPRSPLIAIVAAVVYIALMVGSLGFLRLVTDRDAIEPDASVLVGPGMVVAAAAVVFLFVLRGTRYPARRLPVGRSVLAAFAVWAAGPAMGAILYAAGRTEPLLGVSFFFRHLVGPFAACLVLAALIVVLLAPFLDRPGIR